MSADSCGSADGGACSEIGPDILTPDDLTQDDQLDCFTKQEILDLWRKSESTLRHPLQRLSQQKAALEARLGRLQREQAAAPAAGVGGRRPLVEEEPP